MLLLLLLFFLGGGHKITICILLAFCSSLFFFFLSFLERGTSSQNVHGKVHICDYEICKNLRYVRRWGREDVVVEFVCLVVVFSCMPGERYPL